MAPQVVSRKNPGAHRDDLGIRAAGCLDIFGSITDETNFRRFAQPALHLGHTLAKDVAPVLGAVSEAAKAEKLAQTSRFEFEPSDRFEVTRSHSQQFTCSLQFSE